MGGSLNSTTDTVKVRVPEVSLAPEQTSGGPEVLHVSTTTLMTRLLVFGELLVELNDRVVKRYSMASTEIASLLGWSTLSRPVS